MIEARWGAAGWLQLTGSELVAKKQKTVCNSVSTEDTQAPRRGKKRQDALAELVRGTVAG